MMATNTDLISTTQGSFRMKSPLLAFLSLAAFALIPGMALAHGPKAHAKTAASSPIDDRAKLAVEVIGQFSAALQAGDLERAGKLLADDVLILESGGAENSRGEYLGGHALHDAAFLKKAHVVVTRRTARVEGPLAWAGTESELHTTKEGKPITLLSTETMVLKQTAAGWRIVHIHWSSRPKP
jgi:ketosteroid isomerase-like protein